VTAVAVSAAPAGSSAAPVGDWLLTAPWWHWPRQGVEPQDTVPVLQKYATTQFAAEFLTDPQRRLVFDATTDRIAAPPFDAVTFGPTGASTAATLTKLYQPVHHRHYIVAAELHCERPGLPSPDRASVCEAGFVIRRRRADVPLELTEQSRALQRALVRAHAQLRVVNRRLSAMAARGKGGVSSMTALGEQHAQAVARVAQPGPRRAAWSARWKAGSRSQSIRPARSCRSRSDRVPTCDRCPASVAGCPCPRSARRWTRRCIRSTR